MNELSPKIFTSVINTYLPEPHASLLNGVLFGIPIASTFPFYEKIKAVGLLHIVVLSGTNITIIGAVVGSFFSFLPKKLAVLLTVCVIVSFVAFVGPQPPIIRAGIMGIIALLAVIWNRKALSLYSLVLAGLTTAIIWPQWITTISFQLSYAATLGIILFSSGGSSVNRSGMSRELRLTFAAQCFTFPIILFHFKEISIVAPLSNLLVSFTIAPIMLLGFLTAFIGTIYWSLGIPFAFLSYGLLSYIVFIIEACAKIPYGYLKF